MHTIMCSSGALTIAPKEGITGVPSTLFELPKNFPPIVAAGLQAKTLNGKAMMKFIKIAHAIFRFKNYPTQEETEHVARQCVKAYPFLESPRGTGHVSILIHICTCIYNYSFHTYN